VRARAFIPTGPERFEGPERGGRVVIAGKQVGDILETRAVDGGLEVDIDITDPDTVRALAPPLPPGSFSIAEEDPHAE